MGGGSDKSLRERLVQFNLANVIPDEETQITSENNSDEQNRIVISFDEARRVLDKQFEAHYKNQESTFRLFRSIVAITAVAVTLLSAIFSQTIPVGISVESMNQNANGAVQNISTTVDFAGLFSFSLSSEFPIIFVTGALVVFSIITFALATIALVSILGGILTTLLILSPPLLKPIHGDREIERVSSHEEVKDDLGETYKDWILANDKPLQISNERLGNVYQQLLVGSIFLGMTAVYVMIVYFAAIDLGIFLTAIGVNVAVLYDLLAPETDEHEDFAMALDIEKIVSMNLRKRMIFLSTSSVSMIVVGFTALVV